MDEDKKHLGLSSYFDRVLCFPNFASKFPLSSGEEALQRLIRDRSQRWNVDDIKDVVTAKNLCSCRDPIIMAFKVTTITLNYRLDK